MKKFSVKPRTFQAIPTKVGAPDGVCVEWVYLGRLSEAGRLTPVHFDVGTEHVIALFGKRGSGKSYALGSLLEGLATASQPSSISAVRRSRALLLFDTLGVFQWMDTPLTENSEGDELRRQYALRRGWELKTEPLDVQVWVPFGTRTESTPESHLDFAIDPADLGAPDWGYLLNIDIVQDRMGQLLNDAFLKVTAEGWTDGDRRPHAAKRDYALGDLIECVQTDRELVLSYAAETRRAVIQQLSSLQRNPLFQDKGTPLTTLLRPGQLSVLVLSKLSDELRLVLVTTLIRKVLQARIEASEDEKHLKIRKLSDAERQALKERLRTAVPPCWIAVDEAQNVLPSERKTTATDVLVKLVREGRNFGVSFVVTTQQPTAIDQRILAQVDTIIAHRLTVQTDIEYVRRNLKSNMPEEVRYGNTSLSFDELLRLLDVGQALVSNTDTERAFLLEIRPRLSVHGGF